MPQEAGINERAVSFTKGCYIGQETVARLHYKGKPNRHLRRLVLDRPVEGGESISLGDREIGTIGTAVLSPARGPLALAILRREAEPGDEVLVGDGVTARGRGDNRLTPPPRRRPVGLGGRPMGTDSPLLGGSVAEAARHAPDPDPTPGGYDPSADELATTPASSLEPRTVPLPPIEELRKLLPLTDEERQLDDWGRSERLMSIADPLLNFYYRYWFRVEAEGIENVPAEGGALLVGNHSGALPPDAPMIMQAIRNEHPAPRPLYMLGEHWFKGYPGRQHARQQARAWCPRTRRTRNACSATRGGWRWSSPRA